jgi:polyhydroxyalkanoate synthesis regulator phasin
MIRAGDDVQVVDNATGEDLTAVTLTQVIMEQEKKERDFVPRSILTELIRTGGESLKSLQERIPSPPDLIQKVDQEISGRLETLIQRGEIAEEEGKTLRDQLIDEGKQWFYNPQLTDKEIEDALINLGVPTRVDYERIIAQIEKLIKGVEDL